jgi:putative ABC transport system ATP-binding protein
MDLITCKKLTKEYEDGATTVYALRGIDLTLPEGAFAALAGPSGSGKTTLLNVISGLDRPTGGEMFLDGVDLASLSNAALTELRLHKIGFIFQSFNLIPVLSAVENVAFTLSLQGVSEKERVGRAEAMLERVGLKDQMHRKPAALSGGQQQRVAVARAIVTEPRIVLADEPTANLDSENASMLLDLMLHLNAENGITFLFSTHDTLVMEYSKRLIRLRDGHIETDETKSSV